MSQHSQRDIVEQVTLMESNDFQTRYAGVIALQRIWKRLSLSGLLEASGVRYGQGEDRAGSFAFALTLGPLVQANSVRKVAQRFGAESSEQQAEADRLLRHLVPHCGDQRTLSRFVNQERHDWDAFRLACIGQFQQEAGTRMQAEGVLIVDDFPVPKPYAREMAYLERVWDANQEREVPGYHVVHVSYHHPCQPSYSLMLEPWRKTSRGGETQAKPPHAHRRAQAGEERSKLDIALDGLEQLLPWIGVRTPVIFDGWYFARWFVAALTHLGLAWISQAGVQRKFEVADGYWAVPELIERYRMRLKPYEVAGRSVRAYALPAILRPDKYTRHAQAVQLVLVQGFLAHDDEENIRLLVCNRLDWSTQRILTLFGYRSHIEQAHRSGKQCAGWTEFHSRSWPSQQAHWSFAWLRSLLLALLAFEQEGLRTYSLAQIIQLGIQAAARFTQDTVRPTQTVVHLPRGSPVLEALL
jgi:hypothetical protein